MPGHPIDAGGSAQHRHQAEHPRGFYPSPGIENTTEQWIEIWISRKIGREWINQGRASPQGAHDLPSGVEVERLILERRIAHGHQRNTRLQSEKTCKRQIGPG